VKELFTAGNYSTLDFIFPEFVGGKAGDDLNSVYYTFDPFYPMKKEMFFQRTDIVKHSSLEFLSSKMPKPERTYLQYNREINRWERNKSGGSGQIRSDLLARETLTVATIYVRATSSRIVYDERQVKTLYDFPKDVGGFWTAILFSGACVFVILKLSFPMRVAVFSELLQREEHRQLLQQEVERVSASHLAAKEEPTHVVLRAPSAVDDAGHAPRHVARPAETFASCILLGKQCELSNACQHLDQALTVESPPTQPNDNELCSKQDDELTRRIEL